MQPCVGPSTRYLAREARGVKAAAIVSVRVPRLGRRTAAASTEPPVITYVDEASRFAPGEVSVMIEKPSFSSRRLIAATSILAPPERVWEALTDYDGLGQFIPSLVENRCLERRERGAVLYQVGAQDVAMGVKFRAACTLEITEHPSGLPSAMCMEEDSAVSSMDEGDGEHLFPWPVQSLPGKAIHGDITFDLLKGDFADFRGLWRIQQGLQGPDSSWLVYSLFVRPQAWLPVGLIQNRISAEVVSNLRAVQQHTEQMHSLRAEAAAPAL
ncbi:MAG: hypothetical protein J3K34DRAFT_430906 [Monoraphidium minutum]|nr:MAG: hypothetical protein J3K34DRAFT_430906 [Monoraphidium minutum]